MCSLFYSYHMTARLFARYELKSKVDGVLAHISFACQPSTASQPYAQSTVPPCSGERARADSGSGSGSACGDSNIQPHASSFVNVMRLSRIAWPRTQRRAQQSRWHYYYHQHIHLHPSASVLPSRDHTTISHASLASCMLSVEHLICCCCTARLSELTRHRQAPAWQLFEYHLPEEP